MRQTYKGLLLVAIALAASCERSDPEEKMFSNEVIRFSADVPATKDFLNSGGLAVDGTKFEVYDYLSGYNGTISNHSNGEEFQYFGSHITYDSNQDAGKRWVFDGNAAYRWTHTGTHHFFGWLTMDPSYASVLNTASYFSNPAFNSASKSLSLSKSIQASSPQYDFLYSDIEAVDMADAIPETVPLPMRHLFAALGMSIANYSEAAVKVLSVTLPEFPARNAVKLDYSGSGVALTSPSGGAYPDPDYDSSNPFFTTSPIPAAGITLGAKSGQTVEYDVFNGTQVTQASPLTYRMVWPVSAARLRPTTAYTGSDPEREHPATDSLIVVRYSVNNIESNVRIKFPADYDDPQNTGMFLRPGVKTHLQLQFLDKQILLKYTALPWQYEEFPMSFEGDAISSTQLKFTENTYHSGGKVTDATGKHDVIELIQGSTAGNYVATGTFYIYTPVNATLTVGLGGNADDFIVSLNGGSESITINPERDGGLINFSIRPNGTPQSGSRCSLHFSVRNNGRESDADTEINRDKYYVVIP